MIENGDDEHIYEKSNNKKCFFFLSPISTLLCMCIIYLSRRRGIKYKLKSIFMFQRLMRTFCFFVLFFLKLFLEVMRFFQKFVHFPPFHGLICGIIVSYFDKQKKIFRKKSGFSYRNNLN